MKTSLRSPMVLNPLLIWPLLTGVAVGFTGGRQSGPGAPAPAGEPAAPPAAAAAAAPAPHDLLFSHQTALDRPALEKYASDLKLDMKRFRAALDGGKFKGHIQKDGRQAAATGATGTPTFFINGQRLVGAQPFDNFKKVIDQQLERRGT
jgi:protein-disulfide isomerase